MLYHIESRFGLDYGYYVGDTPKDAFLAMLEDAGGDYGADNTGTEADWIITPTPTIRFTPEKLMDFACRHMSHCSVTGEFHPIADEIRRFADALIAIAK